MIDPNAFLSRQSWTRRQWLQSLSMGVGGAALSQLLPGSRDPLGKLADDRYLGVVNPRHFAPKAKRVIFLCMAGGPSQLETFDYKPALQRLDGTTMPESYTKGMPIAQLQGKPLKCLGARATFARHGESGQMVSSFLPHIASVADDIAVVVPER